MNPNDRELKGVSELRRFRDFLRAGPNPRISEHSIGLRKSLSQNDTYQSVEIGKQLIQ
jgi:hypothetical protein